MWAAFTDVVDRRIPNRAVLIVLALFAIWSIAGEMAAFKSGLLAGTVAFAVGYLFYAFRVMGAGDVKLFAAVALFAGLSQLPLFALATVLFGGLMAVISLASRPRRAAVMFTLRGKGDFGRGIPYGVAIAFGGAYVVWGSLIGGLPRLG